MKEIRLKYQSDTGISIDREVNRVGSLSSYMINHVDGDFSELYDYIVWLEDQLDNSISRMPIRMKRIGSGKLMGPIGYEY